MENNCDLLSRFIKLKVNNILNEVSNTEEGCNLLKSKNNVFESNKDNIDILLQLDDLLSNYYMILIHNAYIKGFSDAMKITY